MVPVRVIHALEAVNVLGVPLLGPVPLVEPLQGLSKIGYLLRVMYSFSVVVVFDVWSTVLTLFVAGRALLLNGL